MNETPLKIIFGEDDPVVSSMYGDYFRSIGYEVTTVDTGDKVIPAMCENKPDIVVLDMLMPLKTGYEVLEEIREKFSDDCNSIPVILLSNLSQDEVKNKALGLGAVEYCVKALTTPPELEKKIQALLAK